MSSANPADGHFLFGLVALQMGFITQEELLGALGAWRADGEEALAAVLARQGALRPHQAERLDGHVAERVARHGDARRAIDALADEPEVRAALRPGDEPSAWPHTTSPGTAPPAPPLAPPAPAPGGAGRYARLFHHARGGLGEVSVARDTELDRQVALKEIQPQFADRPDYRARFVREAEITGKLEHPGIVPVYGLGSYPDGRPYYAMRFIKGQSLHDALKRHHAAPSELGLRALLARFIAVCNAVAYAHSKGVIHRDLKPANVMLGEYGETLVVDWGLAKVLQERDAPGDGAAVPSGGSSATQAGQAVGTPAFMPPEQARGEWDKVGPPSDVWALGATLYAVLTGRPPYAGGDALAQAARGEAPPARQVDRRVPAALSAVCQKAMAPRAGERYGGAAALAQEVERWLADEPVAAYPDPPRERLRRWSKRNRPLVAGLGALLVAGMVGLGLGLWAVEMQRRETAEAWDEANVRLERAEKAEKEARTHLGRARANLKLARQAVDKGFGIAKDHPLLNEEGMEEARSLLLRQAQPFYQAIGSQAQDSEELEAERGEQLLKLSQIEIVGHSYRTAAQAAADGRAVYARLAAARPGERAYLDGLAQCCTAQATALWALKQPAESLAAQREGLATWRKLHALTGEPLYHGAQGMAHSNLALVHIEGRRADLALASFVQSWDVYARLMAAQPDEPRWRRGLMLTLRQLAKLLSDMHRDREAVDICLRAYDVVRPVIGRGRRFWSVHDEIQFGHLLDQLSLSYRRLGRIDKAREVLTLSKRVYATAAANRPTVPDYQRRLARAYYDTAFLLRDDGRPRDALTELARARELQQNMLSVWPHVRSWAIDLAATEGLRGEVLRGLGRHEAALEAELSALSLHQGLYEESPNSFRAATLAQTLSGLGQTLRRLGRGQEALRLDLQARDLRANLVRRFPTHPVYPQSLASSLNNVGIGLRRLGRPEAALRVYEQARDVRARIAAAEGADAARQQALANTYLNIGAALVDLGRDEQAVRAYQQARDLYAHVAQRDRTSAQARDNLAQAQQQLGRALGRLGRRERAVASMRQARDLRAALARNKAPARERSLANAELQLATQLHRAGRTEEAEAACDRALALLTPLHKRQFAPVVNGGDLARAYAERALALGQSRPRAALADWAQAIALTTGSRRLSYRADRAVALARMKEHRAGAAEASAVAQARAVTPLGRLTAARALALCAAAVAGDVRAPLPVREGLAAGYARRAVEQLRRLVSEGHVRGAASLASADFAALRGREDFRALAAGLRGGAEVIETEDD